MAKGIFRVITNLFPNRQRPPAGEKLLPQNHSDLSKIYPSGEESTSFSNQTPAKKNSEQSGNRDEISTNLVERQLIDEHHPRVDGEEQISTKIPSKPVSLITQPIHGEIIDMDSSSKGQNQKEKDKFPSPINENERTAVLARNEAYLHGIKQLMLMHLDPDIFTNAMEELRDRYYGPYSPPPEVKLLAERIIRNN